MPQARVLAIANRSEIAARVARTATKLGWQSVALLGDPDLSSYAARLIGRVERVGPAGSELDPNQVIAAAIRARATALHPGYGFLSERPELSAACQEAGITFIGPSPQTLAACGDKIATRNAAVLAGVPVPRASESLDPDYPNGWRAAASAVGYPVIAKVAGGGGGRGLRVAHDEYQVEHAVRSALREAGASGAGARVYLEHYLHGARHVEVQVAGDGSSAVALGDRDCSIQRRHQKVVEEAPAFGLSDDTRADIHQHAVKLASAVGLTGLATVEFLLSADNEIAFIEVNPRLQVEHTVTEEVTGLDLVAMQIDLAHGGELPEGAMATGHAIQARLYAEDPWNSFAPSPGRIDFLSWPQGPGLRVDHGYEAGDTIPDAYDSMIGKLIARGRDRREALDRLDAALHELRIGGIATNRPWLVSLVRDPEFRDARHDLTTAGTIAAPSTSPPVNVTRAVAAELAPHQRDTAWDSTGPFRIVSPASLVLHGDEGGGWEVRLSYRRHDATWGDADEDIARADDEHAGIAIIQRQDAFEVSAPTGRWHIRSGPRPQASGSAAANDGMLRAPMPGTVLQVNASEGERVAQGDILVVMTAMKIEMTMAAPFDGTVTSVGCTVGELVGSRQILVSVSPDPPPASGADR